MGNFRSANPEYRKNVLLDVIISCFQRKPLSLPYPSLYTLLLGRQVRDDACCFTTSPTPATITDHISTMKYHLQGLRKAATSNTSTRILPIRTITPPILPIFQISYFRPSLPCLFPQSHFSYMPSISTWFKPHKSLQNSTLVNIDFFHDLLGEYITRLVPLESTSTDKQSFTHTLLPLDAFLHYLNDDECSPELPSLYLAQEPLLQSFPELAKFLPTPEYVTKAGNGDIYAVNLWLGRAGETNTPLHKDPNPNLFIQIAGRKRVRLFPPELGRKLMETYTGSGDREFRTGEEMMVGKHKDMLDTAVWGDEVVDMGGEGFEAEVEAGDGLFIPKGWWHAVRGVGKCGVGASVSPSKLCMINRI